MQKIILVVVSLTASVALCVGAPLCYPIAPGDRLLVPANAPAFVGPGYSETATLTLREAATDAGVRELARLDGGTQFGFILYAPGPLVRGDLITLESSEGTCGSLTPSRADVSVLEVSPFPTELGTISFGDPVGFLAQERRFDGTPDQQIPSVRRDVLVTFPDAVLPWLSVTRVTVNFAQPSYGHLARLVTPGTPTVVGSVVTNCHQSRNTVTKPVEVALELAGSGMVPRGEATVEMDCKVAPAAGCSAVPGSVLGLLALWLARRRFNARTPPR